MSQPKTKKRIVRVDENTTIEATQLSHPRCPAAITERAEALGEKLTIALDAICEELGLIGVGLAVETKDVPGCPIPDMAAVGFFIQGLAALPVILTDQDGGEDEVVASLDDLTADPRLRTDIKWND